jgi:hypothetical protein
MDLQIRGKKAIMAGGMGVPASRALASSRR